MRLTPVEKFVAMIMLIVALSYAIETPGAAAWVATAAIGVVAVLIYKAPVERREYTRRDNE